jgi:hypothetical protein
MRHVACGTMAVATVLLGAVACSSEQPGTATPTTGGSSAGAGGATSRSSSTAGSSIFADTDPCSLLPQDAVRQLQLAPGKPTNLSRPGAKDCVWSGAGYGTTVTLFDGVSYDKSVPGQAAMPISIDGVSGRMVKRDAPGGNCALSLEVSQTSSVDVYSVANGVRQRACELSKLVTQAIAPNLPKN